MFAGVFDEFFGVPTHPLAVHAPVVLIPILAVVAVVFAVRSAQRRRIWWLMPAGVFVMTAMLFVAKESGESLLSSADVFLMGTEEQISNHQSLGEATFIITLLWFVASAALAVRDRMVAKRTATALSSDVAVAPPDRVALVISLATVVLAVLATVWLIRTGHAGAESRWPV
ncbi:MAG: hypothetical protein AB8G14_13935 [Ilumatobacter sp.]